MKKTSLIILTITLIATMMLTFVGCSNATIQGQLSINWRPYEKYVYNVSGNDANGTYTVEIIRNTASTVTIGDITLTDAKEGYIINGTLEFNGETHLSSCYMQSVDGSSFLVPVASYTMHPMGEYTTKISGKYEGKKFSYSITEYGAKREETISLSSPYYDNNQIHQILRAVNSMGTSFSFTFSVPLATENTVASLTASCSATESITWGAEGTTTVCNKVYLARQTAVSGASHILYYADKPIKVDGWDLSNVLIGFKEPISGDEYMTYTLESISLTPAN